MPYFTRLVLFLCIAAVTLPLHADTTWDARGEWIHPPAEEKTIIPIADLLANDFGVPGGTFTVRVLSGASEVTELPVGAGNRLAINAEALEYGELAFTYELQSTVGASAVVTSVVSLVPTLQPVTGVWESILPPAAGDDTKGRGAIGGSEDTETSVICRVGDGVDVPALYDPASGELQTYDYGTCLGSTCYLQSSALLSVGGDAAMALPGEWQAGVLDFSTYRLLPGQFTDVSGQVTTFGAPSLEAWPVVGAWNGDRLDNLGLWHDSTASLHYMTDSTGLGAAVFHPMIDDAPAHGYAFSGRWSDCSNENDYLGLQKDGLLTLFGIVSGIPPRGLNVKIVVDPGGGGGD